MIRDDSAVLDGTSWEEATKIDSTDHQTLRDWVIQYSRMIRSQPRQRTMPWIAAIGPLLYDSGGLGSACPERGARTAPVFLAGNPEAMQLHLNEIATKITLGTRAILLSDQPPLHGA